MALNSDGLQRREAGDAAQRRGIDHAQRPRLETDLRRSIFSNPSAHARGGQDRAGRGRPVGKTKVAGETRL